MPDLLIHVAGVVVGLFRFVLFGFMGFNLTTPFSDFSWYLREGHNFFGLWQRLVDPFTGKRELVSLGEEILLRLAAFIVMLWIYATLLPPAHWWDFLIGLLFASIGLALP